MTTKFRVGHTRRLAVALTAFALIGSGCGVEGNSAATVGGVVITQETLGDLTDAGLATTGTGDRTTVNREQLTSLIRAELLQDAAEAQGLTLTDEYVAQRLNGGSVEEVSAQVGIPAAEIRRQLLLELVANRSVSQPWEGDLVSVTFDLVSGLDSRAAADQVRAQLAGPRSEQVLAAQTDVQRGLVADNTDARTASIAGLGVFTAEVGEVLVLDLGGQFGVVRVTDRSVTRGTADLSPFTQVENGLTLVEPLVLAGQAQTQDISVNPRYGRWDPVAVAVVQ